MTIRARSATKALRRVATAVPAAVLALAGTAMTGTAGAQVSKAAVSAGPAALACGAVITHSTTLAGNIGPCSGDGLVVKGSHITVDLAGHSITGSHQGCPGASCAPSPEQVGIHLEMASGDTVENGTVAYFDGGVVLDGGSGNKILRVNAHDNVNRDLLTNAAVPGPGVSPPLQTPCDYGDGISAFSSNGNLIEGNRTEGNGPFSGISLVGTSSHNTLVGNQASDNHVADQTPNGGGTLCGSSAGKQYGGMGEGRQIQDMGIRVEGPGAAYNTVRTNRATDNGLDGIAVFAYFCNVSNPSGFHEPPNHDDAIVGNVVRGTGDTTHALDSSANGIAILSEGNSGVNCTAYHNTILRNISIGNWQDGIFVGGMPSPPGHPQATTVEHNVVAGNHLDGVGVQTGAEGNVLSNNSGHGNSEFDGADYNFDPNCGTDTWRHNAFGTINQPCVAANGGTGRVNQVLLTNESGIATGLQTDWTSPVTVTHPAGFTLYGDAACTTLTGTGQSVTGNGTASPTVGFDHLPAPGTAYFEIAAHAVTAPGGAGNTAVPCTPVEFTGTPAPDTITSVTITGSLADPTFTVKGTGFGSQPPPDPSTSPDGQQGCPPSPNTSPQGFLYGTNLYVVDNANPGGFDAGKFTPGNNGEFDCVGLVIQSWSPTQVVFTMGNLYDQSIPGNDYVLRNGDPVQVVVLGATANTTVTGLS